MTNKVLILPVGLYRKRVWKSLVRSGAQKVYLLSGKGAYEDQTNKFAQELESDVRGYLMPREPKASVLQRSVDFEKQKEVYRAYAKIIQMERKKDSNAHIIIDITSTTMEATIASTRLAQIYGAELSYVPPKLKRTEEIVKKRIEELSDEQKDEGEEPISVELGKWGGLEAVEVEALRNICAGGQRTYESITEFIHSVTSGNEPKRKASAAQKRHWIRVIHRLEEKGLIRILDKAGAVKPFAPTEAGEGVMAGIADYMKETGETLRALNSR